MIKINKLLFAIATVLPTITCLSVSVENVQASSNVNQDSIKSLLDTATKENIDIAEKSYRKQGLLLNNETYWAKDNTWKNSIEALHELTIFGMNPKANVFEEKIDIFKRAVRDAVLRNDKTKAGAYLNGMTIYTFLYQFINNQYNVKLQSGNEVDLNNIEQIFNDVVRDVEEKIKQSWSYSNSLAGLISGQSDEGKTQLKDVLLHDMKCYLLQFGYVAPMDDEDNKKVSSVLSEVLKNKSVSSEDKDDEINNSMKNELSKSFNKNNKINRTKKNDLSKSVNKNLNQKKKTSPFKENKKNYIEDLNVEMGNKKNSKPTANLNFVNAIASIKSDKNSQDSINRMFNPLAAINGRKKHNKIMNEDKNEIKNDINNVNNIDTFNQKCSINIKNKKILNKKKDEIKSNIDNNGNNINLVDKPTINDENKSNINSDVNDIKLVDKPTISDENKNNINDNVDNINLVNKSTINNENKNNIDSNINNINLVDKPIINNENKNNINNNGNNINLVNEQNIINIKKTEPKVENNDEENNDDIFTLLKDVAQEEYNTEAGAESAPPPTLIDIEKQTGLQSIGLTIETKKINDREACCLKFVDDESSKFKKDTLIKNLVNGFNAISENPILRHGGLSGAENFSQLTALFHALALQSNVVQSIILNYLNKYQSIQKDIKSPINQKKNPAILTTDVVELLAKMWILPKDYEHTNQFSENRVDNLLKSCQETFGDIINIKPNGLFKKIVDILNGVLEIKEDKEKISEKVEELVKNSGINTNGREKEDLENFLQECNSGVSDNIKFLAEKSYVCTECSNLKSEQETSDSIDINLKDYYNQSVKDGVVSLNFILQDQYGTSKTNLVRSCSKCGPDNPQKITTKLKFLPQNLVVKFKKDKDQSAKVSIPEFFDLKDDFEQGNPIINEQINNENNTKYFLSAFVFWDDKENKYITFGKAGPLSSWVCYNGKVTDGGNEIVNRIRKFGLKDGTLFKPQMAIYQKIKGQNVPKLYGQMKQSYENWYNGIIAAQKTFIQKNFEPIVESDSKLIKDTNANLVLRKAPLGIRNIGAVCFKSSLMQSLLNIPSIRQYFLKNSNDLLNGTIKLNCEKNDNNFIFLKQFIDLIKSVCCTDGPNLSENGKEVVPNKFYKIVETLNPLFKEGQAGDSKDFLIFILEQLHKILKKPAKIYENFKNPGGFNQYDRNNALNFFMSDFTKETSVISDDFFLFNETTNICQNKWCPTNLDGNNQPRSMPLPCWNYGLANCIIFPLEEVKNMRDNSYFITNLTGTNLVTIGDCFAYNEKTDLFTGENRNYCNLCKQLFDSAYRSKIFSAPNVLILILNRGRGNVSKVNLDTYPTKMNITSFVHNPINEPYINAQRLNPDFWYDLIGVVRHVGPSGPDGHFISDNKIGDQWYRMNDAIVTKLESDQLKPQAFDKFGTPYILFYAKKSFLKEYK